MANICVLEIELSFADSENAKAFAESFEAELKKANENQKGVYIGSERYLFETELDALVDNKLLINGWVKWALSKDEAVKFIAFINGFRELVEAVIYYEETSDCIYGKFIYQDFVLEDNFIPANHKIWDKNSEDDDSGAVVAIRVSAVLECITDNQCDCDYDQNQKEIGSGQVSHYQCSSCGHILSEAELKALEGIP